uniref:HAUS augmin-like complex, subunit 6 n=1 Tax=Nannospalax galili TaxID=1026970 RepID=A0A8C6RJJ4_NANGA
MNSAPATFERQHLWMYLQALGLDPARVATFGGKPVALAHLGVNMFDKLNRDAFHIVSYFLFQTLDESLAKEVFKDCWPPFDQKSDTEFRKHCCEWLKEISAECGSNFPQVVGSLFLSPGGPKFIHLMYHFARFVAIKYIKTKTKNSSPHFAETFNVKPQDMHKCITRCHVARNRFLRILQREHYVTQKYQENAQLSVKQLRNLRSECMGLQNQIKKMEPCDDQSNTQEKIQKVRSLWTLICETLMVLEKEREVVSSVLSLVDQYTLDGTDVVLNVPKLLLDKIEKQICQLQIGNVYEAGKLNLLTIIQLLNEVLKVMKYEHCKADQPGLTIDLRYLEKEVKLQRERLSHMKHMRHKIKENATAVRHSITEKQREWDEKWREFLGLSPFSLIKGWTSAVDLLPPMSPLSFDPVSEEVYAKSILSKYPASLPGSLPLPSSPAGLELTEIHLPMPLPLEVVVSDSPQLSEGKEVKLKELIDTLVSNPFLTRKQIPRTPENLITEIRSSWRRAVEAEADRSTDPIQVAAEPSVDMSEPSLVLPDQRELSMALFFSDFDKSYLPEEKVISDHLSGMPQKNLVTSHIGESPTEDESDLLNKKVMCKQDSECTATKLLETRQVETFSPAVGRRIDVTGSSEECIGEPSVRKTLLRDSFHLSDEDFGILHEILPEEVGDLSLNSSRGSETNFKLEPNSFVHSDIFPDDVGKRQTTPESDFNLQAIQGRYEALKKSLSKIKKESYVSNPETLEQHKVELSPMAKNMQAYDTHFSDICDSLIDNTKPFSHMSLAKRQRSLSPLIKFSLVEQKLRTMVPHSLGELLPDLKEEEISNKSLGAKESLT